MCRMYYVMASHFGGVGHRTWERYWIGHIIMSRIPRHHDVENSCSDL